MAFKINPVNKAVKQNELYVRLYMHQNYNPEPVGNQAKFAASNQPHWFGVANVHDWEIYEGPSSNTLLVARAMGMHLQTSKTTDQMWQNYLSIMFENGRFKGSSFQVMGPVVDNGEWSIVGGTGELALAQGVIKKKRIENLNGIRVIEIDIHALYGASDIWALGPESTIPTHSTPP